MKPSQFLLISKASIEAGIYRRLRLRAAGSHYLFTFQVPLFEVIAAWRSRAFLSKPVALKLIGVSDLIKRQ